MNTSNRVEDGAPADVPADADDFWVNRRYASVFAGTDRDHSRCVMSVKPEATWTADVLFETVARLRWYSASQALSGYAELRRFFGNHRRG